MVASLQTLFTLTEGAALNACALVCKSVSRLREEAPLSECSPNVSARGSAMLTGYVLDDSDELLNACTRSDVLVFPGGGYFMTSDREAESVALGHLAEGFNAFVLRYAVGADAPFER